MKTIYIDCRGELAHRYNTLVSGIYLAKSLRLRYNVFWQPTQDCDIDYSSVFEMSVPTCTAIPENTPSVYATHNTLHEIGEHINALHSDIRYSACTLPDWARSSALYNIIHNQAQFKKIYYQTADHCVATIGSPYYGIYISETNDSVTNEDFFYNLVQHNYPRKFFVCSPNPSSEHRFLRCGHVYVYGKSAYPTPQYCSRAAVQDQIVDLLVLSKSKIMNTNSSNPVLQLAVLLHGYTVVDAQHVMPELHIEMTVTAKNNRNVTQPQ